MAYQRPITSFSKYHFNFLQCHRMNKKEPTILFNNHRFLFFDALTLKLVPNSAVNTSTTHGASVTLQSMYTVYHTDI